MANHNANYLEVGQAGYISRKSVDKVALVVGTDGNLNFYVQDIDVDGNSKTRNLIWNTSTMAWEAATGSLAGGGNVTVNNFPATQAISATSLPLPVGAATEATLAKIPGIGIPQFDYCALAQDATHDIWTFKTGGVGGTLVATATITYTDSTKVTIANVAKT